MDLQDSVLIGDECYREATMFELTQANGEAIQVPGFVTSQGNVSLIIPTNLVEGNFEGNFPEDTLQIPLDTNDIGTHFMDAPSFDQVLVDPLDDIKLEPFKGQAVNPTQPVKRGRPRQTDEKVYSCVRCNINSLTYEGYKKHMRIHSTQKEHLCSNCSRSFNNPRNLRLHQALHNEDSLACPECNKTFIRVAAFRAHLAFHEEDDNVTCAECGEEFEFIHQLEQHKLKRHQSNETTATKESAGHKCWTCDTIFPTIVSLTEHSKVHKDHGSTFINTKGRKKNYCLKLQTGHDCKVCGKRFGRPSQLTRHIRTHTGEKPYVCHICDVAFNQKGSLQSHLSRHSGYRPHQCHFCKAKFIQRGNLRSHIDKVHRVKPNGEPIYKCTECSCNFTKPGALHCHMTRFHFTPKAEPKERKELSTATSAITGDAAMKNDDILKLALRDSGVPGEEDTSGDSHNKDHKFIITERRTDQTVALYSVTVRYEGKVRYYMCNSCTRGFKKPSDLIKHFRCHTREKPYRCEICNKAFSLKPTLMGHMRRHQPGLIKPECRFCKKVFSDPRSLQKHEMCHTGPILHPCDFCGTVFRSECALDEHKDSTGHGLIKDHMEFVPASDAPEPFVRVADGEYKEQVSRQSKFLTLSHTASFEERPFRCQTCHLRFRKSSHLKQHALMHSGNRPYLCNVCQKTFSKYSVLKAHLKTHLGLKPFPCRDCKTAFSTKGSLKRHLQTKHCEERNFMCPYCEKKFKTSIQCKRHMFIHRRRVKIINEEPVKQESVVIKPVPIVLSEPSEETLQLVEEEAMVPKTQEPNYVNLTDESVTITLPLSKESFQELEQSLNQHFFDTTTDGSVVNGQNLEAPKELLLGVNMENGDYETAVADMFQILPDAAGNLCGFPVNLPQPQDENLIEVTTETPAKLHKCDQCGWVTGSDRMLMRHLEGHYELVRPRQKRTKAPVKELTEEETVMLATTNPNDCATVSEKLLVAAAVEKLGRKKEKVAKKPQRSTNGKRCGKCGRCFSRLSDLARHERTHTGERPFVCELCNRRFTVKSTLVYHLGTHTTRPSIKCQICNAVFSSRSSLKVHLRLHTGSRPFACTLCPERFRTSGHFKNHMGTHAANPLRTWPNDAINNIENYLSNGLPRLSDELNSALDEKENVSTPTADSRLPNLNDSLVPLPDESMAQLLNEQLNADLGNVFAEPEPPPPRKGRRKASDPPPVHRCETCQRTFTKPSLLIRHERVHTGERPFACTICSSAFNQRHVLDEHIKAHHGERRYACPYCPFTSVQKSNLKKHIGRLHHFAYCLDKGKEGVSVGSKVKEEISSAEEVELENSLTTDVVYDEVRHEDLEQVVGELFPQVT